jgi:hypothetical protein
MGKSMSRTNRELKIPAWVNAIVAFWRSFKKAHFVLATFVVTALACTASEVPRPESEVRPQNSTAKQIQPKTILPDDFTENLTPGTDLVIIPRNLLTRSYVSRSRADLRSGPGSEFELLDSTLEENDKVVIFDTIGVWSKIVSLRLGISGWIHGQALAEDRETNGVGIKFPVRLLPTVIAIESIGHVYSYGDSIKTPVLIKRGTQFIALRKINGRTLVWLTKTNSVAWISEQSVK